MPSPKPTPSAEGECKSLLSLANTYIQAGQPALARPQLEKIIAKYPDTDWAKQAKSLLDKIGK